MNPPERQDIPANAAVPLPTLSFRERRVLGVLVEKAKTTPDTYPLSLNAMVTACNQKSNRDPLTNLSDAEVEDTLTALQKKGLVMKITGGRVERWRHLLYESLHVSKVELAILAELFLRGPQTEGELRGRASRMEPIDDLETLRVLLKPLVERKLIVYLTPEGRRGTILSHGFHSPEELEHLRSGTAAGWEKQQNEQAAATGQDQPTLQADITALRADLSALQNKVASLEADVRAIKDGLGM